MNIKEYISSGIVESYILGLASYEEQLEFEQLCADNAELRSAKEAFELSLETQALDSAVPPPPALKQQIINDINPRNISGEVKTMQSEPGIQQGGVMRSFNFARLLAAASVILLVGSTVLNFYLYRQYRTSVTKMDELLASNQQLASNSNSMQARLKVYENNFEVMRNPNMAVIAMKGLPIAPQSLTTVFWNKQTNDVYLMVNSLPQPVSGKQYQLWAIVDSKPVSAGMLNSDGSDALVKMKSISKVQAFAITLEKTGGSESPDLKAMYVMGKI